MDLWRDLSREKKMIGKPNNTFSIFTSAFLSSPCILWNPWFKYSRTMDRRVIPNICSIYLRLHLSSRLALLEYPLMKWWRRQRQKRTIGHLFGMKSSRSHWLFLNWLYFELKYTSTTCLRRMTSPAKLVYLFLNWGKGSVQSPSVTTREGSTTQWGFSWALSSFKNFLS